MAVVVFGLAWALVPTFAIAWFSCTYKPDDALSGAKETERRNKQFGDRVGGWMQSPAYAILYCFLGAVCFALSLGLALHPRDAFPNELCVPGAVVDLTLGSYSTYLARWVLGLALTQFAVGCVIYMFVIGGPTFSQLVAEVVQKI